MIGKAQNYRSLSLGSLLPLSITNTLYHKTLRLQQEFLEPPPRIQLEHLRYQLSGLALTYGGVEAKERIKRSSSGYESEILSLNYSAKNGAKDENQTRVDRLATGGNITIRPSHGTGCRSRTHLEQIQSLPPLPLGQPGKS